MDGSKSDNAEDKEVEGALRKVEFFFFLHAYCFYIYTSTCRRSRAYRFTGLSESVCTLLRGLYLCSVDDSRATRSSSWRAAQQPLSLQLGDFASFIRSNGGGPSIKACTFDPRALLSVNFDKQIEFQQNGMGGINGRCAILRMPFERYGELPP